MTHSQRYQRSLLPMCAKRKLRRNFLVLSTLLVAIVTVTILPLSPFLSSILDLVSSDLNTNLPRGFPAMSRGLLVDLPQCRIPDFDPFDPSIAKEINPHKSLTCNSKASITYEDGYNIRINWTVVNDNYNGILGKCVYRPLLRGSNSDFSFRSGKPISFISNITVRHEFVKVICYNTTMGVMYTNFHAFVIPDPKTELKCKEKFQKHLLENKPRETLNVVLLGIDSVSRLNFIRQMPRTRNYLLKTMGAIEMLGYTKVADNTFVNVVPILTGKFVKELPWSRKRNITFDQFGFIWKDFAKRGYRTSYIEDAPNIQAFHNKRPGFQVPPTHFYNRVMSVAMEKQRHLWNNNHNCFRDRLETDIVLKQTRDFISVHRHKPHFAFTFVTRLTHETINDPGSADESHLMNLKKLYEGELLNNTVFIVFSDHGNRFGKFRYSYIGRIEERLPAFYFVFPPWFKTKYPDIITNVHINTNRLTSHFDLYETMQDLLTFSGEVKLADKSKRGISLLREIPRDRSCDQSGILPHWCVCLETRTLSSTSNMVRNCGRHIVRHINQMLEKNRDVCETLRLENTSMATQLTEKASVLNPDGHVKMVQLTVSTQPGGALFEGTVRLDSSTDHYTIIGDISRINRFGDQPICIENSILEKYCFCKSKSLKSVN